MVQTWTRQGICSNKLMQLFKQNYRIICQIKCIHTAANRFSNLFFYVKLIWGFPLSKIRNFTIWIAIALYIYTYIYIYISSFVVLLPILYKFFFFRLLVLLFSHWLLCCYVCLYIPMQSINRRHAYDYILIPKYFNMMSL